MNETISPSPWSGFDVTTCLVSVASLFGSVYSMSLLIPSAWQHGLYGGTAVLVLSVLIVQLAALVGLVGVPGLALLFRRRFRLSRAASWMLTIALSGIAIEVLGLVFIPKGSNC